MTPAEEFGMTLDFLKLAPKREVRFHPVRKWRFDYAWPERMLAVEVEGGIHIGGRHTRGGGFERDLEKYAEALVLGWRVLRVSSAMIRSGKALELTLQLLRSK